MISIEKRFNEFKAEAYPQIPAGSDYERGLKRVFFCGWLDCLKAMQLDISKMSEDEGANTLEMLLNEVQTWIEADIRLLAQEFKNTFLKNETVN